MMKRRRFLKIAGGAVVLGAASSVARGQPAPQEGEKPTTRPAPLFSISLAQWSLHRRLRGTAEPALDHLDFAKAARGHDIDAIEYVNSFFKQRARDEDYLAEMKKRAEDEGVESLLIMCDGEGMLGDPDGTARAQAVENHRQWIEAAATLGCHSIRVNAASRGEPDEQARLAADGLARLAAIGAEHEIDVIVENHGGLSSNGAWLAGVIRRADHPRVGTLPDFGNFRISAEETYDRYQGVTELMPFARAVSAKSYAFDDAGNETTIDYERMMRIVIAAGYHGHVGIEYEGGELSEDEGIRATRTLLHRVRTELAK